MHLLVIKLLELESGKMILIKTSKMIFSGVLHAFHFAENVQL